MNTQEINQLISNSIFDNVQTVINHTVFVNLDYLTNRDYQNQGVNELLFSVGKYVNYSFVFLIRDGVNCDITGLVFCIKTIIKNLKLDKTTCFVYSYKNLEIENTTYIELDVVQMWCHSVSQIINLPPAQPFCEKKFAAMFGRHDLYRLKIFRHLYENYKQDSILSYNSNKANWNRRFAQDFVDDKQWFDSHCPVLLDFETPSGWVSFRDSLQMIHKHYNTYAFEIVCETDIYSNRFFTEKTLKNFYLGKPFLLFAGAGSLQYLRTRGFLTFDPYLNEEYDTIDCPYRRYHAIIEEIDRIAQFTNFELQNILQQMAPIFEQNRQRFTELAYGKN